MSDQASAVGHAIAEELAKCDVRLVASLPDNWLTGLINAIDDDTRFVHVRVNREEAAVGLCSGAYLGALGHMPSAHYKAMITGYEEMEEEQEHA